MERTKVTEGAIVLKAKADYETMLASVAPNKRPEKELPRWRKIGGGTFRMKNGKIIKPTQVFRAAIEDIPKGFRHMVIPVDSLPEDAPIEAGPSVYEVVTSSPGWYNVVDGQGKIVNEKSLRQAAAKELIESLS